MRQHKLAPFTYSLLLVLLALFTAASASAQSYVKKSDSNPHGLINMPCENCHTNSGWKPIRGVPEFDHNRTKYPLLGRHVGVQCTQCHTSLVFAKAGTHCEDCHADIHRGQFGSNCEQCHTAKGWELHPQELKQHMNRFPLVGMHALIDCSECHKSAAVGQFTGLSTTCLTCHTADYQKATEPDHKTAGFPLTCETCHSADTWYSAKFDHLKYTGYALTGAHATLECTACHINGKFAGTPADCYGCHAKDYNTTTAPNHMKAGISTQCQTCHNTTAWIPASFNHNNTAFPLTGAHTSVACTTCHTDNYAGTLSTNCYGCHAKDYNATATMGGTVPNHVNAGFSQSCTMCHTTTTWLNASFDHNATKFPLTGAHKTVPCTTCHTDNYAGTLPTNCYGCHTKDYNNTATMGGNVPNHHAANFPQDCTLCHSTTTWLNANFNHNTTSFPLTGAHTTVPCSTCHTDNYAGTLPTNCYGCHAKDYNSTATIGGGVPNHVSLAYPTDCTICHTTTTWLNATFNHNNTPFPLQGPHINVPCTQCHINGQFAGTPTDCYSCHKADYTGTTNPNHIAAGFPTTCTTCHTTWVTTGWLGATFNHTWFPMTHGGANGVCSTCHTNSSNYSVFVCTNCHTQAQTDPKHSGVKGYVYNSTNCYQCHPTGVGGG